MEKADEQTVGCQKCLKYRGTTNIIHFFSWRPSFTRNSLIMAKVQAVTLASKVINRHLGIPEQPRKGAVRCTGARCCVGARSHSSRKPFRVVTAGGEPETCDYFCERVFLSSCFANTKRCLGSGVTGSLDASVTWQHVWCMKMYQPLTSLMFSLISVSLTGIISTFVPCYTLGKNAESVSENCLLCGLSCFIIPLGMFAHFTIRGKIREQKGIEVRTQCLYPGISLHSFYSK